MVLIDPTPLAQSVSAALPAPMLPGISPLGDIGQFLFDPAHLIVLIGAVLKDLADGVRTISESTVESYVFWTGNPTGPWACGIDRARGLDTSLAQGCRFTDNTVLRTVYGLTQAIALAAMTAILTYALLRSIWERGFRARYTLKAMLPRLMFVIVMVSFGLPLMQGLIDLNNATVHAFWSLNLGPAHEHRLWDLLVPPGGMLMVNVIGLLTAVLLLVLALTAIARTLLLTFLVGAAPLVFLGMLLPETHSYLLAWRRLFFTTIFMQAIQVLVLRVALLLLFEDHSPVSALYGLVAMLLVLKVPSALHSASKAESKLTQWAKHGVHTAERALNSHPSTGRVRAHPAAD